MNENGVAGDKSCGTSDRPTQPQDTSAAQYYIIESQGRHTHLVKSGVHDQDEAVSACNPLGHLADDGGKEVIVELTTLVDLLVDPAETVTFDGFGIDRPEDVADWAAVAQVAGVSVGELGDVLEALDTLDKAEIDDRPASWGCAE